MLDMHTPLTNEAQMTLKKWYLKLNMVQVSLLLGLLFSASVWIHEMRSQRADEKQVADHARVISQSLWSLERAAPLDYLYMAMQMHHYAHITVFELSNTAPFIDVSNGNLRPIDRKLEQLGMIRRKTMSTPIYYRNKVIGQLQVDHINKRIYLYLNWFLVTCLIWVGMKFFLQMIQGKQLLEVRVAERTAELQDSKDNLSVTLNSIADGVIATDIRGQVVRMNSVAADITGWVQADAIGHSFTEIFPAVSSDQSLETPDFVSDVFEAGRSVELTAKSKVVSRSGREYLISLSGAPIRKCESGEVIGVVFVLRDMTEAVALQERLQHSEKMRTIGQLAGGIAHDFNNLLGGIMGAGEMLRDLIPPAPETDKYLNMLERTAENAAALTGTLLVFSRRGTDSIQLVNLHDVIDDTVLLLHSTIDRRVEVSTDFETEDCLVRGDQSLLQSVLLNMGINAAHAIQASGTISYRTRIIEMDARTCSLRALQLKPGTYVEISIKDTGCGIDPAALPHIFEPFFTTRQAGKGTGLGLAAVEATAQQHGGAVSVSSELGCGTTFKIYLPQAQKDDHEAVVPAQDYWGNSELILLVDDEDILRESTGAILERLGYKVITATNGREGLDRFREHAFKLVILDMIMPEMNGRDCFAELKKLQPDVRVILSTGYSMKEDIAAMKANGLSHILKKPYKKDDLAKAVYQSLHS
jgi:PAS domain S-box-containing protein